MQKKAAFPVQSVSVDLDQEDSIGLVELGRYLGLSPSQTQRRIKAPGFPEAFLNENGKRRWATEQIKEFLQVKQRNKIAARAPVRSSNHAGLFAKAIGFLKAEPFTENTPIDLAQYLPADAATVKAILNDWADLKGWLVLTGKDIETINNLPLEGSWPARTVEEILSNLKESAEALQMGSAPQKKTG